MICYKKVLYSFKNNVTFQWSYCKYIHDDPYEIFDVVFRIEGMDNSPSESDGSNPNSIQEEEEAEQPAHSPKKSKSDEVIEGQSSDDPATNTVCTFVLMQKQCLFFR